MIDPLEQRLGETFTARTIMTPREELMCWERGTDLSAFCEKATEEHYDFAPVTEGGRIVGVLDVESASTEPLTDRWLVSYDTEILHLLALFSDLECPGLLAFQRQEVVGLVTPADLNKMPARVHFCHLIGALEMALAAYVQTHFTDRPDAILPMLSESRAKKLQEQMHTLEVGNADIVLVQQLYLSDLIDVVAGEEDLRARLDFRSKSETKRDMGGINELRKSTMHPVRPLLESIPDDLHKLRDRARRTQVLLQRLEEQRSGSVAR